jgi:hypothetical protein
MFSTTILRLALASVNATPNEALSTSSAPTVGNVLSTPRSFEGRIVKIRKPKTRDLYIPSTLRPHVLASDRLRCWTSPHAISHYKDVISQIPVSSASTLLEVMLLSLEEKTRSNYGAGLLRFTQFCDTSNVSEADRCPASEILISAFIASYAGLRSSDCINGWLSGIKWWHTFQGAKWYGGEMLTTVKKGVAKLVPDSSRREKKQPVTLEHMHCLLHSLDLSNAKDAAVYAASSVAFHGICRSCELCVPSRSLFNPARHVSKSTSILYGTTVNGVEHASFDIPWSKTTGTKGATISITDIDDPTTPVPALKHHQRANANVPMDAPLFAFETSDGGWAPLTKKNWLARCNEVWVAAGFEPLQLHAFRIGGCTEMLLRGINPDIVCVQGRWVSKAFLQYWRKIQSILPLFISKSFSAARISLVNSSMSCFSSKYCL